MRVTVKLLGSLSVLADTYTVELELEKESTVRQAAEKIANMYGEKIRNRIFPKQGGVGVIVVVNGQKCTIDEKIKEGDQIFFMPPIGGG